MLTITFSFQIERDFSIAAIKNLGELLNKSGTTQKVSSKEEEEKDQYLDSYANPIFETNREHNTKRTIPSAHRSERDSRVEYDALVTVRKKIGEQVFLGKYYHSNLSKESKSLPRFWLRI